jgi:hypothetical protein
LELPEDLQGLLLADHITELCSSPHVPLQNLTHSSDFFFFEPASPIATLLPYEILSHQYREAMDIADWGKVNICSGSVERFFSVIFLRYIHGCSTIAPVVVRIKTYF